VDLDENRADHHGVGNHDICTVYVHLPAAWQQDHPAPGSYCSPVPVMQPQPPDEFQQALDSLAQRRLRPEVTLTEVPAPARLAPHAFALMGEVLHPTIPDELLASGRFVLLYDPAGQDAWKGKFRVVTSVRADVELDVAGDEMVADVAWSWLADAKQAAGATAVADGGTVTRVLSRTYGALAGNPDEVVLEIRASWTAKGSPAGNHLQAWADLLTTLAGLPPESDRIAVLPVRRNNVEL
jgi:hypothetical protein